MAVRLVFDGAHRHQFLKHAVSAVLIRNVVVAVERDADREQVAVDLVLVAVAVDHALEEGRPADFHVFGEGHQLLGEELAFLNGHQVIAPVVDQCAGIEGAAELAGDVEHVAELDRAEVVGHQLDRLLAHRFVAFHQIDESLVSGRLLQRIVVFRGGVFGGGVGKKFGGLFFDFGPGGGVFALGQIGANLVKRSAGDPEPGVGGGRNQLGLVLLNRLRHRRGGVGPDVKTVEGDAFGEPDFDFVFAGGEVVFLKVEGAELLVAPRLDQHPVAGEVAVDGDHDPERIVFVAGFLHRFAGFAGGVGGAGDPIAAGLGEVEFESQVGVAGGFVLAGFGVVFEHGAGFAGEAGAFNHFHPGRIESGFFGLKPLGRGGGEQGCRGEARQPDEKELLFHRFTFQVLCSDYHPLSPTRPAERPSSAIRGTEARGRPEYCGRL